MNTPADDHTLKIADTPTDDEVSLPDEVHAGANCSHEAILPLPPATAKSKRRGRRGRVQRLTPEEMELEFERVQRRNGKPTFARGTDPDE
jgi:hypothetical protein